MIIVLDRTQEAFTVIMSVPESKEAEIRARIPGMKDCEIVTVEEFNTRVSTIVERAIQKNEYPGLDMKRAIVELFTAYPGTPFGLTFSGGLAVTKSDYDYALRMHARFKIDPSLYAKNRGEQPTGSDPIDPRCHLGALLGQKT